eukprot:4182609-Prymnesium_polylepis.2
MWHSAQRSGATVQKGDPCGACAECSAARSRVLGEVEGRSCSPPSVATRQYVSANAPQSQPAHVCVARPHRGYHWERAAEAYVR